MEKLGFADKWITWTSLLYRDATSSILLNGKRVEKFHLERSVGQGCPLAPYLYLFISDLMSHMINDAQYQVKGMKL